MPTKPTAIATPSEPTSQSLKIHPHAHPAAPHPVPDSQPAATLPDSDSQPAATLPTPDSHPVATLSARPLISALKTYTLHPAAANSIKPRLAAPSQFHEYLGPTMSTLGTKPQFFSQTMSTLGRKRQFLSQLPIQRLDDLTIHEPPHTNLLRHHSEFTDSLIHLLAYSPPATITHMKDLLQQLLRGTPLTAAQTEAAFTDIMDGVADPAQTASLLTLLATREPAIDELTGAATVMRRHVVAIDAPDNVVDTCGTGGVGSNYFNVSTAAALVAAAAGVPVCKHGNRSITSRSGSSDVLRALGVNIDTSPIQEAHCLKAANICFAFAPKHHPAMKHVATIRQTLGFSTIFNILGPLTNPAGARRQVVGTRSPELADKLLEVLIRLGAQRALVVSGNDPTAGPLCEISISADTHIAEFASDRGERAAQHRRYRIRPGDIGLRAHPPTPPNSRFAPPRTPPREFARFSPASEPLRVTSCSQTRQPPSGSAAPSIISPTGSKQRQKPSIPAPHTAPSKPSSPPAMPRFEAPINPKKPAIFCLALLKSQAIFIPVH